MTHRTGGWINVSVGRLERKRPLQLMFGVVPLFLDRCAAYLPYLMRLRSAGWNVALPCKPLEGYYF